MERWTFARRAWASAFFALALALGAAASGFGQEPPSGLTSSAELARLDPARTLAPDQFDQVVTPPAIGATANGNHGAGHQHPPAQAATTVGDTMTPETGHHQRPTPAAAFTCSMHPEIASAQPGACPKCGRTLVKKEKP